MASQKKVSIITGGGSGMGYAVAAELAQRGGWVVNLLDLNAEAGGEAAKRFGATFHKIDVTDYPSLGVAFKNVYKAHKRLDFVFANAGIAERGDFYATNNTGEEPPPAPNTLPIEINVTSVINTSYLAQHYLRQTPDDGLGPRSIVITASCGGFYSCPAACIYGASKFAALGWARNIAGPMYKRDGIRVNAICPGTVRTNLLSDDLWEKFPKEYFVPIEKVVEVVMMLLDGDGKQADGADFQKALVGQTVEILGTSHYFRTQVEYCDEAMAAVMSAPGVDDLWA
ncbi:hypothetical protein LTR37_000923 [Vermiconidia calcicola]|uniref:Uncharacterized protein n=1 Tax=Vermiconidia calcicola TaxID=1690605 RepID=A0ACC3NX64_9PEZI|nr:hypothetical protein LTR37_000923 [Vermiconidia calcicola]